MSYTVEWVPLAEQQLAAIWLGTADRDTITAASHALDQMLRADPEGASESRPGGQRIVFAAPLAATCTIDRDERLVTVASVWRFRTRG